jgi:hypothetical protein
LGSSLFGLGRNVSGGGFIELPMKCG